MRTRTIGLAMGLATLGVVAPGTTREAAATSCAAEEFEPFTGVAADPGASAPPDRPRILAATFHGGCGDFTLIELADVHDDASGPDALGVRVEDCAGEPATFVDDPASGPQPKLWSLEDNEDLDGFRVRVPGRPFPVELRVRLVDADGNLGEPSACTPIGTAPSSYPSASDEGCGGDDGTYACGPVLLGLSAVLRRLRARRRHR